MKTTNNIKTTTAFKMVDEEARYLSTKLQNRMYVIFRNKSLFIRMSKEEGGVVLSTWDFGNKIN